jgi:tetratricopeptide (TPR) repeat protein
MEAAVRRIARFERRDWLAVLGIFALALCLRFVYLWQVRDFPLVVHPIVDALAYDAWAQRIAGGAWWGGEAFYQAPAYPYFLAVIYRIAGHDLWTAHVVQMAMGGLSCVLLFIATRAGFGFAPACVAGIMLAIYPPAIFFDGILGKQGLGLLLMSWLLAALLSFQNLRTWGRCLQAGILLGLLALTRENALAFVPMIPLWLLVQFRDSLLRSRVVWIAAFVLGTGSVLLPVGLRNYVVGDAFALTTTQLGSNFYIGNSEQATGIYVPLLPGRESPVHEATDAQLLAERALGRPLTRGEVSDYWLERGFRFIAEHPIAWLKLMALKLALTWNEFEIGDTEDIYVYAEESPLLGWLLPWLHFGVLAPLAVGGLLLAWGGRHGSRLLAFLAFVYTGSVILFITSARFRYPLVPLLIPLAAFGVARSGALLLSRRGIELLAPFVAVVVAAVLVNLPLVKRERLKASGYANVGIVLLDQGRPDAAEPYLLRAMESASDEPDLRYRMGWMRLMQGRLKEAEVHLLTMTELEPRDHRGHAALVEVYRRSGRPRAAQRHARLARQLDPERAAGEEDPAGARDAPPP